LKIAHGILACHKVRAWMNAAAPQGSMGSGTYSYDMGALLNLVDSHIF
jgi:hypothetical protein